MQAANFQVSLELPGLFHPLSASGAEHGTAKRFLLPRFLPGDELALTAFYPSRLREEQLKPLPPLSSSSSPLPSHREPYLLPKGNFGVTSVRNNGLQNEYIKQLLAEFHVIFLDIQSAVKAHIASSTPAATGGAGAAGFMVPAPSAAAASFRRSSLFPATPKPPSATLPADSIAAFSQRYRQAMKVAQINLETDLKEHVASRFGDFDAALRSNEPYTEELLKTQLLISSAIRVWHIVEVMFLDVKPNALITEQLCIWLQQCFEVSPSAPGVPGLEKRSPEEQQLWAYICRLVMRGDIDTARQLLPLPHDSLAARICYPITDRLLAALPRSYAYSSVSEFRLEWARWQEECRIQTTETLSSYPGWSALGKLLSGDLLDARDLVGVLATNWQEYLVAVLFLTAPTTKTFDLSGLVHEAKSALRSGEDNQAYGEDAVFVAAMEFDVESVINVCSTAFDWWMVAHLVDLLQKANKFQSAVLDSGADMRECFLLEYSTMLFSSPSLWRFACGYLASCPMFGSSYMSALVERISPHISEKHAVKLLSVCSNYRLFEEKRSLLKILGKKRLRQDRLGSALTHFISTQDSVHVTAIALAIFEQYSETGVLPDLNVLDAFGADVEMSQALVILRNYKEFHRCYAEGRLREAASLLVDLIAFERTPKRFWFTFLLDALPLLESEQIVFGVEATFSLMKALEELTTSHNLVQLVAIASERARGGTSPAADIQEKMDVIRLALSRNLSRAIVSRS